MLLDILWETWNNDPALMNSISAIVVSTLVAVFGVYTKTLKKNNAIKIEVGDVKEIIPVIQEVAKELKYIKDRLEELEEKTDIQSDMFFTTFNNTKLNAPAKEVLKKQYFNLKEKTDKVVDFVEEFLDVKEEIVEQDQEREQVEDIYLSFKGAPDEGTEEITV